MMKTWKGHYDDLLPDDFYPLCAKDDDDTGDGSEIDLDPDDDYEYFKNIQRGGDTSPWRIFSMSVNKITSQPK